MTLSRLVIKNFKAFEEQAIDLRPITVILGPNNSGKSSILAAPRLLAQTIESQDSGVPLLLNGIFGDFGTYKDVVYMNHRARRLGLELEVQLGKSAYLKRLNLHEDDRIRLHLEYKFRTIRREVVLQHSELFINDHSVLTTKYADTSERHVVHRIGNGGVADTDASAIPRSVRFTNFLANISFGDSHGSGSTPESQSKRRELFEFSDKISFINTRISQNLRRTEYVGAMRVAPSRTYLFTGENRGRVGSNGEYTASILAMDSSKGGSKSQDLLRNVSEWLALSRMRSDVKIVPISDRHYTGPTSRYKGAPELR